MKKTSSPKLYANDATKISLVELAYSVDERTKVDEFSYDGAEGPPADGVLVVSVLEQYLGRPIPAGRPALRVRRRVL